MSQRKELSITIGGTSYTYYTGGVHGLHDEPYRTCDVCGLDWPMSQIETFAGKDYGIPCECANDIPDIQRKGY